MPRPKKYHTEGERREAARQRQRKYFNAHREAIYARAKRNRKRRETIKAMQQQTSEAT